MIEKRLQNRGSRIRIIYIWIRYTGYCTYILGNNFIVKVNYFSETKIINKEQNASSFAYENIDCPQLPC